MLVWHWRSWCGISHACRLPYGILHPWPLAIGQGCGSGRATWARRRCKDQLQTDTQPRGAPKYDSVMRYDTQRLAYLYIMTSLRDRAGLYPALPLFCTPCFSSPPQRRASMHGGGGRASHAPFSSKACRLMNALVFVRSVIRSR